jgi:hypothetical protein
MKMLAHRIGDKRLLRLIAKWLKVGVMESNRWKASTEGTPQGAVISPLLANVYLHYVLDLWVARERKRSGCGEVTMVRYADDFIIGFEHKEDAERFLTQLRSLPRPVEAVTDRVRWCPRPGSDDRVGNQSQRLVLKPLQSGAICDSPFHGGSGDAQSGAQPGASVQAAPSKAQSV